LSTVVFGIGFEVTAQDETCSMVKKILEREERKQAIGQGKPYESGVALR